MTTAPKKTKSLRILCIGIWGEEFDELNAQGHTVILGDGQDFSEYDLIMGPQCWRLLPHLTKYLPLALKEARATLSSKMAKT